MKRTIKKQFWLTEQENQNLQEKAHAACMPEAGLLRFLIRGYHPREQPGEAFFAVMQEMSTLAERIELLAASSVDADLLRQEVTRWHEFQKQIEDHFLLPVPEEF